MNNIELLPSILAADHGKFLSDVNTIDIPEISWLHVDVMDGHFVPNLTFGAQVVASLKKHTRFQLDVHLMIENPDQMLDSFLKAGADRLIVHQEAAVHLNRTLNYISSQGCKAGVAINPATPLTAIEWVLADVDVVLLMSVNPGFGGQFFIPNTIDKIRQLVLMRSSRNLAFRIELDGGIDVQMAPKVVAAGGQDLVAGSAIFRQDDRAQAARNILKAADTARQNGDIRRT